MNFRGVIAEDEELLRTALSSLLKEAWPQLQIVAECEDGASALESIAELQPDVAFLDIRMPGLTGIEVARGLADASPAPYTHLRAHETSLHPVCRSLL